MNPEPNAIFHDGKSPKDQAVRIELGFGLSLLDDEGRIIETWPFDSLSLIDQHGQTTIFTQKKRADDARLIITERSFADRIFRRAPHLRVRERNNAKTLWIVASWSSAAAVSLVLLTILGIPYLADRLAPLVPASIEVRLGENVKPQVYALFGVTEQQICRDEAGQRILTDLVGQLSSGADIPFELSIEMVEHPIPNAFALPGGQIVILNTLLDKMPDGEAFAAVIAHEIGHVANRDVMRRLIEAGGRSFILSSVLGDFTGGTILLTAAEAVFNASYSRERESAADAFAVAQLRTSGADPAAIYRALDSLLSKQAVSDLGRLLSSHPVGPDRLAALKVLEDKLSPKASENLLSSSDWQALKTMCKEGREE